ncbi:methionine synthase [Thermosipho melanesiensis]|uniref:Vitamin B12 dependent methionine synthase, activation region n=2 Tax=Thermosipho melanesiensis TaxID=46541 RepID=A6LKZ3_THEM4|nr:methionine synthase [Thermosipho melanesiensis]ABR30594.1 Vitamin B12 dependent methionine synthase, activation region [Thermosipho melanesiensis BI429]APT73737.1 methionine synthase [Thermosipho melanesiensis]OOC35675.1 methionine synthase [Thermosipho melanesiensis]OOC38974.1 methionine synthase [Thermosipho melanesiensis]OOC39122.1 methionine synthase [Thermosipho melanesiensis]
MVYIPEKHEYMPSKKIFLARAGMRYKGMENDLNEEINEIYLEGLRLSKPIVWFDTIKDIPNFVPKSFKGIKKITIFVSTLGKDIDEKIEEYMENGEIFKGAILDAWASEALEKLNDSFDKKLREKMGKGTMRFSPGYGDVDIRKNKDIINFLKIKEIKVLQSGVMIPRKTTTCMVGWW